MAFKKANVKSAVPFNSAYSSKLLGIYTDQAIKDIQSESAGAKSRTFSPSGFRCLRKQWFQLRGVDTDFIDNPDIGLDFRADIGTARHISIQRRLKRALGEDWISVQDYLKDNPIPYEYGITDRDGIESYVHIQDPPIRFAVDGIIRIDGKVFLLEIKTTEYSAFTMLTQQKPNHEDQIKLYSYILGIRDVIFLYEDRQNGGMKAYQYRVSDGDICKVRANIAYVMNAVEHNLAPDRLPSSDYMCQNCEYSKKCKQW